jgi:penicillin amidase/acyl-homoserine-lactone acylase
MAAELLTRGDGGDEGLRAALEVIAAWNGSADQGNRQAALAILTGQRAMGPQINQKLDVEAAAEKLKEVAAELQAVYGRLDPEWGEVSRVARGSGSWPTDGGPDTLRAVYAGGDLKTDRFLKGRAGDTYIIIADWAPDGSYRLSTIHQYGSATMDAASPHYADQAPMFAAEAFKEPPMTLEGVLAEQTRDYRPGRP